MTTTMHGKFDMLLEKEGDHECEGLGRDKVCVRVVAMAELPHLMGGANQPGEAVGQAVGAVISIGIRIAVNGLYIAALLKFLAWQGRRQEAASDFGAQRLY